MREKSSTVELFGKVVEMTNKRFFPNSPSQQGLKPVHSYRVHSKKPDHPHVKDGVSLAQENEEK